MNKKARIGMLATTSFMTALVPVSLSISCASEAVEEHNPLEFVLVATPGWITDKSFNQQLWDAMKEIDPEVSDLKNVYSPSSSSYESIAEVYELLDKNPQVKTIIAPGYYHYDAINNFFTNNSDSDMKFVLFDSELIGNNNVASFVYDAEQAAFLAGEFVADYLVRKDPSPTKHVVGMFGGANVDGVTSVLIGFTSGIAHHNASVSRPEDKIYFANFDGSDDHEKISKYTDCGFAASVGAKKSIGYERAKELVSNPNVDERADIILPVAGDVTTDVVNLLKESPIYNGVRIIGVDSDQSKYYENGNKLFLTSIIKDLKNSLIYFLQKQNGEKLPSYLDKSIKGYGETTVGDLNNKLVYITPPPITGNATLDQELDDIYTTATVGINNTQAKNPSRFADWASALAYIMTNSEINNPYN